MSAIALVVALAFALGACHDDAPDSEADSAKVTTAPAQPAKFKQPNVTAAAAGQASSRSYKMTFSLGGQVPPLKSTNYGINQPPTAN